MLLIEIDQLQKSLTSGERKPYKYFKDFQAMPRDSGLPEEDCLS